MTVPFVILAGKNDIRVTQFQKALNHQGLLDAHVVTYSDYIDSSNALLQTPAKDNFILRIDSPGRDLQAQARITERGISPLKYTNKPFASVSEIAKHSQEKGRIIAPHQYFYGYQTLLHQLSDQLTNHGNIHVMNHPSDIALAFDKVACQRHLQKNHIPIPKPLPRIHNYQQLREQMSKEKVPRVFIKLRHGSSASGIIALETSKNRIQIKTTIETKTINKQLILYNSRKIQYSRDDAYIETLVNKLCTMEVQVERWIPKAQVNNHNVDLRILMIAGKAQHTVLRMSQSPMTNLHLLNQRADATLLKTKMTTHAWDSLIHSCENVAKLFPNSLYIALDVVVSIGLKQHFILEVNAFGDLLKDTVYQGLTPQEAQIKQLLNSFRST